MDRGHKIMLGFMFTAWLALCWFTFPGVEAFSCESLDYTRCPTAKQEAAMTYGEWIGTFGCACVQ